MKIRPLITCLFLVAGSFGCGPTEKVQSPNNDSDPGESMPQESQKTALHELAEGWGDDTAAESKTWLDQMTVHDHFVLEYVGDAFKEAVFRRACDVDPNVSWTYDADGSLHDCPLAAQQWQECIDFVGLDSCEQNLDIGRGEVLIYYRCERGEIDEQTCQTYAGITQDIDAQVAETTDTIVRNSGDECQVGVDPNCYP